MGRYAMLLLTGRDSLSRAKKADTEFRACFSFTAYFKFFSKRKERANCETDALVISLIVYKRKERANALSILSA